MTICETVAEWAVGLRIRLRDGSTHVAEGREPGSCGRPLAEQRAVVEERLAVAGLAVSPAAS